MHFVISLKFPCLSLFTVLFACVFFFGCYVVRDLCGIEVTVDRILQISFYPTPTPTVVFVFVVVVVFFLVPTYISLFNTSDSYLKSVRA